MRAKVRSKLRIPELLDRADEGGESKKLNLELLFFRLQPLLDLFGKLVDTIAI